MTMTAALGVMSAVMTLAELQTTADEVSPDHDRHNDNGVHADRLGRICMDAVLRYNRGPSIMTMTAALAE